ncbi:MAG: hypothetical protein AABZ06_01555 [Bdellovibrionota bacterium]
MKKTIVLMLALSSVSAFAADEISDEILTDTEKQPPVINCKEKNGKNTLRVWDSNESAGDVSMGEAIYKEGKKSRLLTAFFMSQNHLTVGLSDKKQFEGQLSITLDEGYRNIGTGVLQYIESDKQNTKYFACLVYFQTR